MRYLFPALIGFFILFLTSPAFGTELDDPYCVIPARAIDQPVLERPAESDDLPEEPGLLIIRDLALRLDDRTSVAFNYGLFSLPDQGLQRTGPSFSIGLRCLFD